MNAPSHRSLEANVPRYTSYPTAPHFHPGVGSATVERWLDAVPQDDALSLYLHVPFCDRLCWFCACHTKQTRRYEPVAAFLATLHEELRLVGGRLQGRGTVRSLHLGGGSPTMLRPDDLLALRRALDAAFDVAPDAEISVEIDPNDMDEGRLDALAAFGLTRASLGIQDFDPRVQAAINREQGFAVTAAVVNGLRARGVRSVNLDLLYGLPHQSVDTLSATLAQALSLAPDRLALFGYAHVPWFKTHQRMIDEAALPDPAERRAQAEAAAALIVAAGHERVGLDHFARPEDDLAQAAREGRLRRNFQGYTDDPCDTLIGLGPSAISRYREGHVQNEPATASHARAVAEGRLPVARGLALSAEDRLRGWVIERLMCDLRFSAREARDRFGPMAEPVLREAERSDLLRREGELFYVDEADRLLVRRAAAGFDAYLARGTARHSAGI